MKTKVILTLFLFLFLMGPAGGGEREEYISLDFHRVDINLVIRFISETTETNFIVDPRVKGEVTIISPARIPVEAVYSVFKSILEMHNFSLVQAGEVVKIIPSVEARQRAIRTEVGREIEGIPPEDIIVTQLIPLEHADVNQVRAMLTPLVSQASNMVAHLPTNILILTETSSNIQRLLRIIKEIDVKGVRVEREIIPLRFASAEALGSTLTSALEERHRPGEKAPERTFKIIPDARTNRLVVVATPQDMKDIKELIEKLDRETPAALSMLKVYHLENVEAEELIKVLAGLKTGASPARGASLPEIKPSLVADKATNSLIIVALPEDHAMFRKVIEELDIRPKQVLVEMLVAEVSMDIIRQLGIELASMDSPVEGSVRGMGRTDFAGAIATAGVGLPGLVIGAMKGTVTRTIAGQDISVPKIGAILQAYEKEADFEVLATPHVIASNNKEARILIGERIPFIRQARVTEEVVGIAPTVIQTFDYRDVGIELNITPRISRERFIHLDIHGKVSRVIGDVGAGLLTTFEREVKTAVTVEDKNTVVIGGLTRDDESETIHKVPLLGDLPILGFLFRRKSKTAVKRNLLIFITPHVIETAEEAEDIRREKGLEQEEFKKR